MAKPEGQVRFYHKTAVCVRLIAPMDRKVDYHGASQPASHAMLTMTARERNMLCSRGKREER